MGPTKVLSDEIVKKFYEKHHRLFYGITYIGDSHDFSKFLNTYPFIEINGIKIDVGTLPYSPQMAFDVLKNRYKGILLKK